MEILEVDDTKLDSLAKVMVPDVDVLCARAEQSIVGQFDGTLIVTMEDDGWYIVVVETSELKKQGANPDKFLCGIGGSNVLSFCSGKSNKQLLMG
jgi:hypothetical protein